MHRYLIAAALVALAALASPAHAERVRSRGEAPSRLIHAYDSSVGSGASAEAVDLVTDLASFGANTRTFSCLFIYDQDLLLSVVESGSVAASQLATPATNGTAERVIELPASLSPLTIPIEGVGWIWQSKLEASKAAARAICND